MCGYNRLTIKSAPLLMSDVVASLLMHTHTRHDVLQTLSLFTTHKIYYYFERRAKFARRLIEHASHIQLFLLNGEHTHTPDFHTNGSNCNLNTVRIYSFSYIVGCF